jgi:dihydroorotate dehydrogenase (NAD+) catalytic subunit
VTNIVDIAKAAEDGGATSLSLINTLIGMAINWKTGKAFVKNGIAGYSGPAIKPIAVANLYKVYNSVKLPIIAMGGIENYKDVLEFIYAGASAVAIGTSQLINPLLPLEILNDLSAYCLKTKIDLKEIKGKVIGL